MRYFLIRTDQGTPERFRGVTEVDRPRSAAHSNLSYTISVNEWEVEDNPTLVHYGFKNGLKKQDK